MGRPALELGTWGSISSKLNKDRTKKKGDDKLWTSTCWVRDLDGVKRQATGSGGSKEASLRDLQAKLKTRFIALNGTVKPETTIEELGTIWLEGRRKSGTLDESSLEVYALALSHLNVLIGAVRVREMTPALVDRTILDMHEVAPAKAKRLKNVLLQMLRLAVRQGALPANPAADMDKLKRPKPEVVVFSLDDLAVARGAIRTWMDRQRSGPKSKDLDDIMELLLGSGFRIGEVLGLRWCDIDLDAGVVTVAGTVKRTKKGGLYRKPDPKNPSSHRRALLPQFALDVLRRRAAESLTLDAEPIFQTRNGTWLDPHNVRRSWRAVRATVDLDWAKLHTVRKTVGSLVRAESDIATATATLGNASEQVMEDHYLVHVPQSPDVRSILDALAPRVGADDE